MIQEKEKLNPLNFSFPPNCSFTAVVHEEHDILMSVCPIVLEQLLAVVLDVFYSSQVTFESH